MPMQNDPPNTSIAARQQRQLQWARLPFGIRVWKKFKVGVVVGIWALLSAALGALAYDATGINILIFLALWMASILLVGQTYAHRIGVPYSIF